MKIDYSKWSISVKDGIIRLTNSETNEEVYVYDEVLSKVDCNSDDPIKALKKKCKEEILKFRVRQEVYQLEGNNKRLPVEDNLDYIENEAEKRGLI